MKFGIRRPNLKKSLKAHTTGKLKRSVKKALIPGYGKKGIGWIKNPQKAAYNKVYNKTSVSLFPAETPVKKQAGKELSIKLVGTKVNFQPIKRKKTWLWVLGWIFIFPVPLTILMVKNQKLNKWVKIGIIVAAWILYLIIAFVGGGSTSTPETTNHNQGETGSSQQQDVNLDKEKGTENTSSDSGEETEAQNTSIKESTIEDLVNGYNATSESKLEYVEDFVVSSEDSGHYRTEFRLTAYSDAVGKSYKLGDQIVDIISTQTYFGDINVRIYTDGATFDHCKELVQYASKLLDPTMTDATVNETIAYISENKVANGYYYGELGLLLLGSDDKGYDLMIKTD